MEREAGNSPPLRAQVKNGVELYLHSPIRLLTWCYDTGAQYFGISKPLCYISRLIVK